MGGIEPPLGTKPPLGIYRVSSQLLCNECCSLVGCLHCGVIGSPRSPSTCCIVGADHIRNANSHTWLECLLCATRCGRDACCQYVNVLLPPRGVVGRMGVEPIRIPYCLVSYSSASEHSNPTASQNFSASPRRCSCRNSSITIGDILHPLN